MRNTPGELVTVPVICVLRNQRQHRLFASRKLFTAAARKQPYGRSISKPLLRTIAKPWVFGVLALSLCILTGKLAAEIAVWSQAGQGAVEKIAK